jgi:uncharacterized protein (TIGR02757 family)
MNLSLKQLESLYDEYNKLCYIHPDPLEFIYNYKSNKDREIVGLIASSLAYGNVKQILKSVTIILNKIGRSPQEYILSTSESNLSNNFKGFRHRFTTEEDLVNLLLGIKTILKKHTSLKENFIKCYNAANKDFTKSVILFTEILNVYYKNNRSYLCPSPKNKSACKRLMLYLRWMIRKDEVDPGCWHGLIPTSKLIIPLDTHMFNIAKKFNLTSRKTADFKTAIEITDKFKTINSTDPVKYDFSLTRFGIRNELNYSDIK